MWNPFKKTPTPEPTLSERQEPSLKEEGSEAVPSLSDAPTPPKVEAPRDEDDSLKAPPTIGSPEPVNADAGLTPPSIDPLVDAPAEVPEPAPVVVPPLKKEATFQQATPSEEEGVNADASSVQEPVPLEKSKKQYRPIAPELGTSARLDDEAMLMRTRMRHRLIGASVLLLAFVFLAPLFMDDETSMEPVGVDTAIPTAESLPPLTLDPVTPKAEEPAVAEVEATPVKTVTDKTVEKKAAKPAAKSTSDDPLADIIKQANDDRATSVRAVPKPEPEAQNVKGWYIQVVATSSELKADQLIQTIRAKTGLPAYKERMDRQGGTIWRVRVGPFSQKAKAQAAQKPLIKAGFVKNPRVSEN